MKKKIALSLVFALSLGLLAGCGGGDKPAAGDNAGAPAGGDTPAPAVETVNIAGLAPLTGDVAVYGLANTNGATLAFEEINANGGILGGAQIKFNVEDEKGDATEALNAFNKLIDGNVALLGDVTSKPTMAVAEVAADENYPMIAATATAAEITHCGDNIFRVCFIDPFQGTTMANFATETLGATSAAVMYNTSDDYSTGIAKAFEETAKANGMTVVMEGYGANDKDFKAQLTSIAKGNPDVLMLPDYYGTVSLIAAQAQEIGLDAVLLGADGWDGVLTTVASPDVVEGAYFCSHYAKQDQSDKVQNFIAAYKAANNDEEPNSFAALAYDAAYILADAIDRAGSTDAQAIIDALQATSYDGVTGHITFDEIGDPVKSVNILQIVDGEYTFHSKLEPVAAAPASGE